MARRTRSYTRSEQAASLAALAAAGGNLARAAKETGIPRKTLAEWAKRRGAGGTSPHVPGGGEDCSPPKKGGSPPGRRGRPVADPPAPDHIVEAKGGLAGGLERAARGGVLRRG